MVAKKTKAPAKKTPVKKPAAKKPAKTVVAAVKKTKAMKAAITPVSKPNKKVEPTKFAAKTAKAAPIKGVDVEPVVIEAVGALKAVPAPVVVQEGKPQLHTMAKSYVRSTGAGGGKLRGETYQCTVSLTKSQRDQVVAAATFRGVSLAEMIRSCVVEHLDRHSA